MKEQIQNYLDQIYSEIKQHYANEINLKEAEFENYSKFDYVNFHLIYQYILNDNSDKNDFFISIPEDEYRPNFFHSIFQSIILIKLYQNFFNFKKINYELGVNDLIYSSSRKRVFEVLGNTPLGLRLKYKFPKGNEGLGDFTIQGHKFTKINPNVKRTATNYIQHYEDFLIKNFGKNFPFITDFKNRTLVISDRNFFNLADFLPARYITRSGAIQGKFPFFNYMAECCNNFETAQNHILGQNDIFDEIIVIADSKYRDTFDFILQEKYRGKYKNIILIGTEKPNSENQFLEWWWSNDEVKIANDELPNDIIKISLRNNNLYLLLIELSAEIQKIKDECKVNLVFILKYTNFFFRMILVNSKLSKGIFHEYQDRLNHYFQSEVFSEELHSQFYNNDIYNPDTIKYLTIPIFEVFAKMAKDLEDENLKWNYIKQTAKKNQPRTIFLVIEKKNYDAVSNQIINERISNIRLISDKRIDDSKLYLDKWLNDQQNSLNRLVIIPYLNNMELFAKIKGIKGTCEILCYENLDEISFDNVFQNFQEQEKIKLNHKDRLQFFKTNYTHSIDFERRDLDYVFSFDLNDENFKTNPYESFDLPKEKAFYEIEFNDGSIEKFDSSKGVFLVENGELIKTTIGEVYSSATIRFYQNNNREEFGKILKIFDTEHLLESFDKYSDSWKQTLRDLSNEFGGIEMLYNQLFTTYKINFNTFRLYFDENSQTRFPRVKTMNIFRDFCLSNNFINELIVNEFDKFKVFSKKDHSIRQQAGRILGNDLLDYVASSKVEKSDSLKKLSNDILEKLTTTIQEKTVIKKTLIDE
jgi:hypothetical protein